MCGSASMTMMLTCYTLLSASITSSLIHSELKNFSVQKIFFPLPVLRSLFLSVGIVSQTNPICRFFCSLVFVDDDTAFSDVAPLVSFFPQFFRYSLTSISTSDCSCNLLHIPFTLVHFSSVQVFVMCISSKQSQYHGPVGLTEQKHL